MADDGITCAACEVIQFSSMFALRIDMNQNIQRIIVINAVDNVYR